VGRSTLGDDLGELLEQHMPRQKSMAGLWPHAFSRWRQRSTLGRHPLSWSRRSEAAVESRIHAAERRPAREGIHRKQSAPASVAWPASSFRMMVAGDEFAGLAAKPPPDASFRRSILFA